MGYSEVELRRIHARTGGDCHLCGRTLPFHHYGARGGRRRTRWEVDHDRPRAKGGRDTPRNRLAACRTCNRSKGPNASRPFRKRNGLRRRPRSARARRIVRRLRTTAALAAAGALGVAWGPEIAVVAGAGLGVAALTAPAR